MVEIGKFIEVAVQIVVVKIVVVVLLLFVVGVVVLGWKKTFEKMNTLITCELMVISQLLGGQF